MTAEYPDGDLPPGIRIGVGTRITGGRAFKGYKSTSPDAAVIGQGCTLDGVSFAVGALGRLVIGDFCHFSGAVLLCEAGVTIGNHVSLGWNVTVADSDVHPIDPGL